MTEASFATQRLDHLGIVAGVCHKISLVEAIDEFVGPTARKVTVGQAVMAMILNALGFVGRPLYLTPEFFSNKPVDLLIDEKLCASDFNDDSLGRALDCLYEKGVTEGFAQVASGALASFGIDHRFVHLDSTTFSLHGEYATDDADEKRVQITHGYSKDHRPDLKQVTLQLICCYQSQIPVWLEALDGNQADKSSFPLTIEAYVEQMRQGQPPYFIADSALYTAENISALSEVRWITRPPETIKAVKELYQNVSIEDMSPMASEGYRCLPVCSNYGDVRQRWLLVYSTAAYRREAASLQKRIAQERQTAEKSLQQLGGKAFDTAMAAQEAVAELCAKWRFHRPEVKAVPVPHYGKRGRPKKGQPPKRTSFRVEGVPVEQRRAIDEAKREKGKFVLATNELNPQWLSEETMLSAYKAQGASVERGFRFLKDPLFFASSLFLDKPQRIMALLMVMGLSLLVYALGEHWIRTELKMRNQTLFNQVGKPTQRPTLRRIFQVFEGIDLLLMRQGNQTLRLTLNLRPIHVHILSLFGEPVRKYYIPDQ